MRRILVAAIALVTCPAVQCGAPGVEPVAINLDVVRSGIPPASTWGERGAVVADVDGDGRADLITSGGHLLAVVGVFGAPAGGEVGLKQSVLMLRDGAEFPLGGALTWCESSAERPGAVVHIAYNVEAEVLSGWPLEEAFRFTTEGAVDGAICADVDNDGRPELVASEVINGVGRISAYDPWTGILAWSVEGWGGGLRAAQLDGDPALEIIAGTKIIDGATLAVQTNYAPGFGIWTAVGDLEAGPELEILAASQGSTVTGFGSWPFSPIWSFTVFGGAGGIDIADVFPGGRPEILTAARQGALEIWDAGTRTVIASYPLPRSSGSAHPRAGDFDGDGMPEVSWAGGNGSSSSNVLAFVEPAGGGVVSSVLGTFGPYWASGPVRAADGTLVRAILALTENPTIDGSLLWLVSDDDLALRWPIVLDRYRAFDLESANLTTDPGDELVVAGNSTLIGGGEVRALRPDGTAIWSAGSGVQAFASRDVVRLLRVPGRNGDPDDVLAIAEPRSTGASGTVAVLLRGSDGVPIWTSIAMGSGFTKVSSARLDQFDDDPAPEFLLATGGFCWIFDSGSWLLDAVFACSDETLLVREVSPGIRQLVGTNFSGDITIRSLPDLDLISSWNAGHGLVALSPIPPFGSAFLYAREREIGVLDLDTGGTVSTASLELGRAAGWRDRVRIRDTDSRGSVVTIGTASGVFDIRVGDDRFFLDGFE